MRRVPEWLSVVIRAAVGHDMAGAVARVVIALAAYLGGALTDPAGAPSASSSNRAPLVQCLGR